MPSDKKHKPITYICLDTNIVIDCAFSRSAKCNPNLLEKLLDRCRMADAMLLVPETVLLELQRASEGQMEIARQGLADVQKKINELSELGYSKSLKGLRGSVAKSKKALEQEAREGIQSFRDAAADDSVAVRVSISPDALVEATKMAIAGEKPSKHKESFGLLQGDCLIVAALCEFAKEHEGDRLVLCSSNTADFAEGESSTLHDDIRKRLPELVYYSSPVELLNTELPVDDEKENKEVESLAESYKAISEQNRAYTENLASALKEIQGFTLSDAVREAITANAAKAIQPSLTDSINKLAAQNMGSIAALTTLGSTINAMDYQSSISKMIDTSSLTSAFQNIGTSIDVDSLARAASIGYMNGLLHDEEPDDEPDEEPNEESNEEQGEGL